MQSRRIIDAFLFDGELTLLEHRLAETYDLVDLFVLIEAGETFQGARKPMSFAEHRDLFARYSDKIRHVALPKLSVTSGNPFEDAWKRERVQRNALSFTISEADPTDVILIMDADEIPSRDVLQRLRRHGIDRPRRLLMTRHYQAVDLLAPGSPCCPNPYERFPNATGRMRPSDWNNLDIKWFSRSGVAAPASAITRLGYPGGQLAFDIRRSTPLAGGLPDAGRHLCFVDPTAHPTRKLERVAHVELATQRDTLAEHLEICAKHAIHHRGWWYAERPKGVLPDDLVRLARRSPKVVCGQSLPLQVCRCVERHWAWVRCWPSLPSSLVRTIDGAGTLLKLSLSPLLLLLVIGRIIGALLRREPSASAQTPARHQA